jgi:hypothetical protein
MKIQTFIFNWPGKTKYALKIQQDLVTLGHHAIVINSDPEYQPFNWINLGNTAYFGAQWRLAVDLFQADVLFHVQADVEYENWQGLFENALYYKSQLNWGVYSPDVVNNTFWAKPIEHLPFENLQLVTNSDCTCWFIDKYLISQFKALPIDWKSNFYGWGIDCIICALSYLNHQPVIRDSSHKIIHHPGRGYATDAAWHHMQIMLQQLPTHIKQVVDLGFDNSNTLVSLVK